MIIANDAISKWILKGYGNKTINKTVKHYYKYIYIANIDEN